MLLFFNFIFLIWLRKVSGMQFFHHEGKIVGGVPVRIEDFPYQVSLQQPSHFCGGSLIGTDWVLSAAHCGA